MISDWTILEYDYKNRIRTFYECKLGYCATTLITE